MGLAIFIENPLDRRKDGEKYRYASNAQDVYDRFCEVFPVRADAAKERENFVQGKGKRWFAECVTPEGYSVWILYNSNLSSKSTGNWYNTIKGDTIREQWEDTTSDYFKDKSTRVTFAYKYLPNKESEYVFIGVYKYEGTRGNVKIYRRIDDVYNG